MLLIDDPALVHRSYIKHFDEHGRFLGEVGITATESMMSRWVVAALKKEWPRHEFELARE